MSWVLLSHVMNVDLVAYIQTNRVETNILDKGACCIFCTFAEILTYCVPCYNVAQTAQSVLRTWWKCTGIKFIRGQIVKDTVAFRYAEWSPNSPSWEIINPVGEGGGLGPPNPRSSWKVPILEGRGSIFEFKVKVFCEKLEFRGGGGGFRFKSKLKVFHEKFQFWMGKGFQVQIQSQSSPWEGPISLAGIFSCSKRKSKFSMRNSKSGNSQDEIRILDKGIPVPS